MGTSIPGNIGAICRSMLNYGFDRLRFVSPQCDIYGDESRNRAKHAQRVLNEADEFTTLQDATHDCVLVVGTSGKREVGEKTSKRHFLYPWEFGHRINAVDGKVALVFGEEGKGLSTEHLALCDDLVTLPTWEGYPIANLSHAVNAFLYELQRQRVKSSSEIADPGLPEIVPLQRSMNSELRKILNLSLKQYGEALPGLEERGESFAAALKRSLHRSQPTEEEATRLIGGFVDATTSLQKESKDERWLKDRRRRVSD